jgi:alkylation response protein AidB-like acyl-CoA dehydrogenase
MDFSFTAEEEDLRTQVRAFLSAEFTDEVRRQLVAGRRGEGWGPLVREFFNQVYERGWAAISWPKEYGGGGGSRTAQFIVEEEFYRTAQITMGGGTGAPSILAAGTDAQKRAFVPAAIRREVVFCQGYSEPQCGSDLAGVRCRATRVGDKYVINGQKIFTTNAQSATHIYMIVRTDPQSKRHRGLSVLLVPMDLPGITVRPLWTIQTDPISPPGTTYGEERTNEVFFDDVEVSADCLLGEEGGGWAVARRGLNLDRVGAWRHLISVMRDEDLVNWLKPDDPTSSPAATTATSAMSAAVAETASEQIEQSTADAHARVKHRLRDDPCVRDKVAELWIEAEVCRLMTMRSISIEKRGGNFTYEGSAEKVWAPEHSVRSTEAISQILGPYGQLLQGSPGAVERGIFAHSMLGAFQSTVNHGSVQVMRDQIARIGLGLPRPAK